MIDQNRTNIKELSLSNILMPLKESWELYDLLFVACEVLIKGRYEKKGLKIKTQTEK